MNYLVTGAAGFIGMHACIALLKGGHSVVGLDNLNSYYERDLKLARLRNINTHPNFQFHEIELVDRVAISDLFKKNAFKIVLHLAAQAGVRHSIVDPYAYSDANLTGFLNILEACRNGNIEHLVYASSSSVYGLNSTLPFSEHDGVDHPVSLYAATKKANELMAHSYSHLYGLPTTGLRLFTVYGPWGRPDMALFLFIRAILKDEPIDVFNHGHMIRDFTYIEDITNSLMLVGAKPAKPDDRFDSKRPDPASSSAPYRVFNVGNSRPTPLMDYIQALENSLGMTARKNYLPIQPGDVLETSANIEELTAWVGYRPQTTVQRGVKEFVDWYRTYYKV